MLNLSGYDYIAIIASGIRGDNFKNCVSFLQNKITNRCFDLSVCNNRSTPNFSRDIKILESGISISDGCAYDKTNNDVVVPLYIFGITGSIGLEDYLN